MASAASPVDWRRAEQVAVRIANRDRGAISDDVTLDLSAMAAAAEDRVESVTGLRSLAGAPRVRVIDRAEWVRLNISSFRRLLQPLLDEWQQKSAKRAGEERRGNSARSTLASVGAMAGRSVGNAAGGVGRQISGAEVGLLLGWMSTKVLGQYDVLLASNRGSASATGIPAASPDDVVLVGPNLAVIEQRFGFDPERFRMWVLLHELTHRAQFTGVPWLHAYFADLVDQSLRLADPDPARLLAVVREAAADRGAAAARVREGGLVGLMASPEQRAVLDRIGGLMSLLEGHGDVTMDRAAEGFVDGAHEFGTVLRERRKQASPLAKIVQRLTGLEAKLDQYAAGARFIEAIESASPAAASSADGRDHRAVDRCWRSAEHLPTIDEIRSPDAWLARMALGVG